MSFNTSNIFSDTYVANVSVKAPVHLVDNIPISKNNDNLKLGDQNNSVVECLELQVGTQLNAPIGVLDQLNTGTILPLSQDDPWVSFNANLYLDNKILSNVKRLTIEDGVLGQENQVLSVNALGDLKWKTDDNDVAQWSSFPATENVDLDNNDLVNTNLVNCNQLITTYKIQNQFVVSPNGNDQTGNGTYNNPYLTIQKAIDSAEELTTNDNIYRYVIITGGNYSQNLTITKKIYLKGEGKGLFGNSEGCVISGNIVVNVDTNGNDMFNNGVYLSGLLISGSITDISNVNSMLIIDNCYIYTADDNSGRGVQFSNQSNNSRFRMTNCVVISGGGDGVSPLVELTNVGSLIMSNCFLSAKGNQNCLKFSGNATCDTVSICKFECSSTSESVKALVEINSDVSGTYTFGNCAFFYSSTTNKSANTNASGILNFNNTGNNNILSNYNSFFLLGTSAQNNYAIQDLNAGTAEAMLCLYYFNNASLNNAFAINATQGVNKFQLSVVS
jgi:hypothetical protein